MRLPHECREQTAAKLEAAAIEEEDVLFEDHMSLEDMFGALKQDEKFTKGKTGLSMGGDASKSVPVPDAQSSDSSDSDSEDEGGARGKWRQDGGWGSFSRDEVEELGLQGIRPWDHEAEAALQVLFPGRGGPEFRYTSTSK